MMLACTLVLVTAVNIIPHKSSVVAMYFCISFSPIEQSYGVGVAFFSTGNVGVPTGV
jgi:hypothetical protein